MTPRSLLPVLSFALLVSLPAAAQTTNTCNLGITMTCANGTCTATTTNNGNNVCSGQFIIGMEIVGQNTGSVTGLQNSLGIAEECFDSATFPQVGFPFAMCFGNASLGPQSSFTMSAAVNGGTAGSLANLVAFTMVNDPSSGDQLGLAYIFNSGGPVPTCTPIASVPSSAQSGNSYDVEWFPVNDPAASYIVEESTSAGFTSISGSQTTSALKATFQHTVTTNTTFFYRVRATTCGGAPGTNSPTVSIVVQAVPTFTGRQGDVTTPVGSTTPVQMKVFIPGPQSKGKQAQDVGFVANTDKPYLSVSPPSGTIGPNGTTLTVTANPSGLPAGANTGTVTVTANGGTLASKEVSVSLVTPVTSGTKSAPSPNSLIIPAVAHAPGALGPFQSDVRLTNAGSATTSYQVTYTPTRKDVTQSKTTTVDVDPGQTIALNDILRDFFGVGATDAAGDLGQGSLQIRPINSSSPFNYASSRTFTFNPNGTYGQFVAAIPFSQFATKASIVPPIGGGAPPPTGTPSLSLQQVSCCAGSFRTNLGLVEGSGQAASGKINVYDNSGNLKGSVSYSLQPGEHHQDLLTAWKDPVTGVALPEVSDGRIEVTVESPTGAVTAYASVLDNKTNDPLEVTPVQVSNVSATRYIQPGMANINVTTPNNFHSDVRIFNGGTSAEIVAPTFYSFLGNPPKSVAPLTIQPGETKAFSDVLVTLFNAPGDGGSIVFSTSGPSSLVSTGRTYTCVTSSDCAKDGTFGQFIPGVTAKEGVAAGDAPLQILQLDENPNFRTNVGVTELTGNAANVTCAGQQATACVHLTAYIPDSKVQASTDIPLGPNEFKQLSRPLAAMYPGQNIYNARISVQVTSGSGRVAAYGSVIDNKSLDPTYVPAQAAQ